jgi:putative ABC transport system permease protein
MIKNFIISNLRSLWKNKSHTFINTLGLSLGITCAILIFLIIKFELSFDTFHANGDRIFRVVTAYTQQGTNYSAGITYPLVPAIKADFGDPEYVTIVDANHSNPVIKVTHPDGSTDKYKETNTAFVDPDYLKMFKHEWIEGNEQSLNNERTVVLTESIAKKYFGNTSALNKVISVNTDFDATVTGVIKDPPLNTDFAFKILFSNKIGAKPRGWTGWSATSSSINCYVRLNEGVTKEEFESKLAGWHMKYFTGDLEEEGKFRRYFLQPLNEIHFDTRFSNFGYRTISETTLLTLGAIGLLLLLTACINFINLNTVLIINRSKEAGIRKVMGSTRNQLVWQFLGETFIVTAVALLLSTGLAELALIYLTPVLGYRLEFEPLTDITTIVFLGLLPLIVTGLSGLYPAFRLARFQPVKALKNKMSGAPGQGLTLRRSLIVFQLMISQVLVICTIVVVRQIDHFMSQPLGLNSEAVIEFELPQNEAELIHRLHDRLESISGIEHVAMSNTGSTSENSWGGDFVAVIDGKQIKENTNVKFATEGYLDTYGLTLLHGEGLVPSDSATRFVVNEKFTQTMGFKNSRDAIGTPVEIWGNKAMITGIVKDFNANSLKETLRPVIILNGVGSLNIGAVRMNTQDMKSTIAEVQKAWEEIYPNYVFGFAFLDDTISQFYDAERRNGYLIGLFAGVAIFIGCIGLFGLVSFMAKNKTKEVGIRKTLGATVSQVVVLFSKEFLMLIVISFVISAPLAYYVSEQWLDNFAYKKHPDIVTFFVGIGLSLLVVMSTVGIKSYRAATANPVDALRDE